MRLFSMDNCMHFFQGYPIAIHCMHRERLIALATYCGPLSTESQASNLDYNPVNLQSSYSWRSGYEDSRAERLI